MRCSMCGHESPTGSSFCLNCGSSLAPPMAYGETLAAPQGLPAMCGVCRGENPPGMKFCRSCGSGLSSAPVGGGPMMAPPAPPPLASPAYGSPPMGPPPMGPPPMGPSPMGPPPMMPPPMMPAGLGGAPGALPSTAPGLIPPGVGGPGSSAKGVAGAPGGNIICPRCGTPTPVGFAYCQGCGLHMQGLQPTDPSVDPRSASPASPGLLGSAPGVRPMLSMPVDPQGATLASDGARAGASPSPAVHVAPAGRAAPSSAADAVPAWGTAVLVNRDGSDGQRFPLAGEYSVVGRAGANIAFEEDRFLARQHARFERGADGSVRVLPLDDLNGVFRRADAPVTLSDGMTILVGREVLRYEKIAADEIKVTPLIRHGVALFGSPPREPWGRFMQIVPSGGYRDVRHLAGEEVVLGREEGDIVFRDDAFMSRRHAAVTWDGTQAQITDLGSSNGTFVRIAGATPIKHGDHLRMGDQLVRIELGP